MKLNSGLLNSRPFCVMLIVVEMLVTLIFADVANAQLSPQPPQPAPIIIRVHVNLMPYSTNALFAPLAGVNVMRIYNGGEPLNVINNHKLKPSYIAQSVNSFTNYTAFFSVDIIGRDSSVLVSPSNIRFIGSATDSRLDVTDVFNDIGHVFSMSALGVLYGTGGATNTLFTSFDWTGMRVNRFIYEGATTSVFAYIDLSGQGAIESYMNDFTNFFLRGTWILDDVLYPASATVTLQTTVTVMQPMLAVKRLGRSDMTLHVSGLTNDATGLLMWYPSYSSLDGAVPIASINEGDPDITIMNPGGLQGYLRVVVE